MIKTKLVRAIHTIVFGAFSLAPLSAGAESFADDVVAVGPVSTVSAGGQEFSVLGRSFHAKSPIAFVAGDYVAVHGVLQADGTVEDVWIEAMGRYVPGSDAVYQKGVVTEVRPFVGQFSIGGSRLDYIPVLATQPNAAPSLGAVVAISGIQPAADSVVLVDGLMAAADQVRDSLMKGGGAQSALMKGGGVQSSLMKGGGVQSALMKGGGVQSSLMKGGGVQSALMKGGGVHSSLMKGVGVQS
ncbi:MAG: hypothetical protein IT495_21170, partial [Gammaproteobacteria bacterium]|nr:hypothetical protein [Gammaproteobacteria bacterium]